MTDKEIKMVKELCEQEILIAIQRFEQLTGKKVNHLKYSYSQIASLGIRGRVKIVQQG